MSLIAWNARGLGDPLAFDKLQMIVRSFSPDSVGRSGGLALVWGKDWDVVIQSFSRAYIDAFITSPDGNSRRFTRARVFHLDFFGSDYKALHVVLDFPSTNQYVVGYGNRRFTFEPLWRTNDG
ncbi:hypothetical protein TIFTF001_016761 [Ficus carica]|uniref:Uncharacterized protein n=1 Tax=Ficus carica TaxID=3494 RepID=A0AA88DIW8_FICCA|nr:hypothetical protein TIFTF001_016761 [Ficus carica]